VEPDRGAAAVGDLALTAALAVASDARRTDARCDTVAGVFHPAPLDGGARTRDPAAMYKSCIFCSAHLGRNHAVEHFPVGSRLAFDAWKGRLWAICPACARWNLSPIEERWEAVEAAEKLFRDSRLRVQSENVGLARLPDGTSLVRVGAAMPGELAAWRYGTQLLRRRKRYFVVGGIGAAAGLAAWGGLQAMGVGFFGIYMSIQVVQRRWNQRVILRVAAEDDPARRGIVLRRWHLPGMRLAGVRSGSDLLVEIRDAHRRQPGSRRDGVNPRSDDIAVVSGEAARAVLSRAMVHVNRKGASRDLLREANHILADAGSADVLLRDTAIGGAALGDKAGASHNRLMGPGALAFEMALNEEAERRALEGELAALEAAWKEAEEIAAIADALPGEALVNRLLDRLIR
jgi:hypothetical protein